MKINQIQSFIERATPVLGHKTVVTFSNSASYYGFFVLLFDWEGLKAKNKWRFVPINKFAQFDHEFKMNKSPNPDHSLIIDGDAISKLEIIKSYSLS